MLEAHRELGLSALALCASLGVGCNADRPKEPQSATPRPQTAPAPASDDTSFRYPPRDRLVAFGDVHGDIGAVRRVLELARVIDGSGEWVAGKTVVVQTGDQLDRGDDEPEVLELFSKLKGKAEKAGGAFYVLNGNHEVMNVAGDYRYVTEGGFRDYDGTPLVGMRGKKAVLLPEQQRGRAAAFLPGGPGALKLAERPVVIAVGETVFAHGGVLPGHVRYGIGRINDETSRWMKGETQRPPPILEGDTSPIWARDYSDGEPTARACRALDTVLAGLRAKRMVVGHTVQKSGITSGCDGKVWRIDVGLAKHYGGQPAALEIRGDVVRAIGISSPSDGGQLPAPLPAVSSGR